MISLLDSYLKNSARQRRDNMSRAPDSAQDPPFRIFLASRKFRNQGLDKTGLERKASSKLGSKRGPILAANVVLKRPVGRVFSPAGPCHHDPGDGVQPAAGTRPSKEGQMPFLYPRWKSLAGSHSLSGLSAEPGYYNPM